MKRAKYLVAVLILLVAGYLFLVYFSATETRFACDGTMTSKGTGTASKVFVRLQEYRWWVKLWSTSQGSLWLEIPNTTVEYYPRLSVAGDQLQVFNSAGTFQGQLSKLSSALGISTPIGLFEGACSRKSMGSEAWGQVFLFAQEKAWGQRKSMGSPISRPLSIG